MITTKAAYFHAAPDTRPLLPRALSIPDTPEFLAHIKWDLLTLNRSGCHALLAHRITCACHTLLLPEEEACAVTQLIQARQVVSTGLSPQSSITFSSLQRTGALICVQRMLLRCNGSLLEPQEFLLTDIPLPPEEQLLLFGTQLLLS